MNQRKMLAILGSPHVNGTTAAMLSCAANAARQAGWHVDIVNLYKEDIAFCKGCRTCLQTKKCIQTDSVERIAAQLRECDMVVLAAPVYWANVPAAVKNLFDRLLGVAMEETATFPKPLLAGKKYVLMTACKTPFPFSWIFGQSRGALRSMDEFFRTAGMKCAGRFVCANTEGGKGPSEALRRKIRRCWGVRSVHGV